VTDIQAKYIAMFYGEEVLAALRRHSSQEQGSDGLTSAE
jgi:hypothetical protein